MIIFGEKTPKNLEPDWLKVTPAEKQTAVQILEQNPNICVSYASEKQEAPRFIGERMSQMHVHDNVHAGSRILVQRLVSLWILDKDLAAKDICILKNRKV